MLKVGLNPYGLCCNLGIQGSARHPKDLDWFVDLAEGMHAGCIEFHCLQLLNVGESSLDSIRKRLESTGIEPIVSGPWPLARISEAIPIAHRLGARKVRTHVTPILCGDRAKEGENWPKLVDDIKCGLAQLGPIFSNNGLTLAIENHQDFGSNELLELCEIGGKAVGITLDTGNPLAVAEDPISFAEKVAPRVRHVHLKDYRVQTTQEGIRLVRCAIGEGAIPFSDIERILATCHNELTASLEPGALESRHVRLLTDGWWQGYSIPKDSSTRACLAAAKQNAILEGDDWRTPWERGAEAESVCEYEMEQMMKSVKYMQALGWLPA